jgi:DNA repair exonuclease SbcCD ATPase subunit
MPAVMDYRHELHGPYAVRTVIEWAALTTESEADGYLGGGDVVSRDEYDDRKSEVESLQERVSELESELDEAREKVDQYERDFDSCDINSSTIREVLARYREAALRLGRENAKLRRRAEEAEIALKSARARTCTVCGPWSAHDDKGHCSAHGKPIKGLKRKTNAA